MNNLRFLGALLTVVLLFAPAVWAQDPNVCDEPGDAPDVTVGDLHQVNSYGNVGDIYAYSVGTVSCNIGTCWLNWISETNEHPVIGQSMYRLKDGRLTQIGQSWLKHGFFALSEDLCSTSCLSTNGDHLGVNCSDPYSAGLNGQQSRLGPRWQVNPTTGNYAYPFEAQGVSGDAIYKRLQVHADDLDPALNVGASYFVEGQYISSDDAVAGNGANNSSYRSIDVLPNYDISLTGTTIRQLPAIEVWAKQIAGVAGTYLDIANDGRLVLRGRATDNGDGTHRFEYAIQNLTSDRAGQAFWVPVPAGSTVTGIGFHDVDYHSGEPFDNTDWAMTHDTVLNRVVWNGDLHSVNPNANALRWGTMYNFWFDVDGSPGPGSAFVDLFKPGLAGDPDTVGGAVTAPNPCNSNGVCEASETCSNCPNDCNTTGTPTGFCGDGICEEALAEDCLSCASDCSGTQSGNPGNQYCCGNLGGTNPVDCADSRCTTGGFSCGTTAPIYCCGEGTCDPGEDSCVCAADCGAPPASESVCGDGLDNDCDGNADCGDRDCCSDGSCITGVDNDLDGITDCDCDDSNGNVWLTPDDVSLLTLDKIGRNAALSWAAPGNPGASAIGYETLRSGNPGDFVAAGQCLGDGDPADLANVDIDLPVVGSLYQYLIRATNDCPDPDGTGTIGSDSAGSSRDGLTCP